MCNYQQNLLPFRKENISKAQRFYLELFLVKPLTNCLFTTDSFSKKVPGRLNPIYYEKVNSAKT